MQALARVQARIWVQQVCMAMGGQVMQQRVEQQLRHEAQIRESEEGWSDSIGSVEQIQAKLQQRQQAAVKRERAMAYAVTHQWQVSSRQVPETSVGYDQGKKNWGQNWLKRWMAARPWESSRVLESVEDGSDMKKSGHRPQFKMIAFDSDSTPSSSSTSAVLSAKVKSATSPGIVAVNISEGAVHEASYKPSPARSRSYSSLKEPSPTTSGSFRKPEKSAHARSRSFSSPGECPVTVEHEATKRFLNSGKSTPGHKPQKPTEVNKTPVTKKMNLGRLLKSEHQMALSFDNN